MATADRRNLSKEVTFDSRVIDNKMQSLSQILHERALGAPDDVAYRFVVGDSIEGSWVSYKHLYLHAAAIARELVCHHKPGSRVLVLYPPGLDYVAAVLGTLHAGMVCVPAYPPPRSRGGMRRALPRLRGILEDSATGIILAPTELARSVKREFPALRDLSWICECRSDMDVDCGDLDVPQEVSAADLAFLQYTSGTTGQPKGVALTHGNLLANLECIRQAFGHNSRSVGLIWLPPYHDMGLIGGILQPLYAGFPVVLMSPLEFSQRPLSWLRAISVFKATTSGGPNFAFQRCVDTFREDECNDFDLGSWDLAFCGSETIRADTLKSFSEVFEPYGFRRSAFCCCYGLAEATLFVSSGKKGFGPEVLRVDAAFLERSRAACPVGSDSGRSIEIVSCGATGAGHEVRIVDPDRNVILPESQVGEIWISGPSVSTGYWNVHAVDDIFGAKLKSGGSQRSYLKSGDLGFIRSGSLFVMGRAKDLIIVRGKNYYPDDIERTTLKACAALRPRGCVAFSVDDGMREFAIVIIETNRTGNEEDTRKTVRAAEGRILDEQGLRARVVLAQPGTLPKTTSGKTQRMRCREQFISGQIDTSDFRERTEISSAAKTDENDVVNIRRERVDRILRWLQEYTSTRVNARLVDERRCIPPNVVLDFGNKGLLGMFLSQDYGGLDFTQLEAKLVIERLASIDLTLALFVGLNNTLGIRPIQKYGSPSLTAELLPRLGSGRELAAFALTESGAGSNPRAMSSTAVADAAGWRLHGKKIWSGSSAWAGILTVFAQTQDKNGKALGISSFCVRQGVQGLRMGDEALTMGVRGMVQNDILMEGVHVSPDAVLGEIGKGLTVAQDAMSAARSGIGAICIGAMKRCLQLMCRYSERRVISTGRLIDNPITRLRVSALSAELMALDALVTAVAEACDSGRDVPAEVTCACKVCGSELLWKSVDGLMQLLGGRGYTENNRVSQMLRDARLLRIFEGPTETLECFIGSSAMHSPGTITAFMRTALADTVVSLHLEKLIDRVVSSKKFNSSFDSRGAQLQWQYKLIGGLVISGLLACATRKIQSTSRYARMTATGNWMLERFYRECEAMWALDHDNPILLDSRTIAEIGGTLAAEIGELGHKPPEVDISYDRFLITDDQIGAETIQSTKSLKEGGNTLSMQVALAVAKEAEGDESKHNGPLVQEWLVQWLARKTGLAVKEIDVKTPFAYYGVDSVVAADLALDLGRWLGMSLDPMLCWDCPTIEEVEQELRRTELGRRSNSK